MTEARELDAAITKAIFHCSLGDLCDTYRAGRCNGTKRIRCGACGGSGHGNCYGNGRGALQVECDTACGAARFSEDIAEAWKIVEQIGNFGFALHRPQASRNDESQWKCLIAVEPLWTGGKQVSECGRSTAAIAICKAALEAVKERS